MKKKVPVIMIVIGFLFIVLGVVFIFYSEFSSAKLEKLKIEENIVKEYNDFKKNVEEFNEVRTSYYTDVVDNLFLETVSDEYKNWILSLDTYTNSIDKVEKSSSYLKENCVDMKFSKQDISNKCDSFIIAYETVMNYYTKDINEFNTVIESYLNQDNVKEDIIKYNLKYNYTDINSDGKFIGKD